MNIRRGLFRLWLISAGFFILCVAWFCAPEVWDEFDRVSTVPDLSRLSAPALPFPCDKARGELGSDYIKSEERGPRLFYGGKSVETCWMGLSKMRSLYPEYNDLSNEELSLRVYKKAGLPARPWFILLKVSAVVVFVPLAVLGMGVSILWTVAGFSQPAR
jgi:hypothetical protein